MMVEKRVNIGLNEKTHTQAKVIAVLNNITLNDYFKRAIENAVVRDKKIFEKIKD